MHSTTLSNEPERGVWASRHLLLPHDKPRGSAPHDPPRAACLRQAQPASPRRQSCFRHPSRAPPHRRHGVRRPPSAPPPHPPRAEPPEDTASARPRSDTRRPPPPPLPHRATNAVTSIFCDRSLLPVSHLLWSGVGCGRNTCASCACKQEGGWVGDKGWGTGRGRGRGGGGTIVCGYR